MHMHRINVLVTHIPLEGTILEENHELPINRCTQILIRAGITGSIK